MKRNMLKDYKEQIQDADLVLVGCLLYTSDAADD